MAYEEWRLSGYYFEITGVTSKITKDGEPVEGTEPAKPGDEITTTIVVENKGSGPAYETSIDITIPDDVSYPQKDDELVSPVVKIKTGDGTDDFEGDITIEGNEDGTYTITIDGEIPNEVKIEISYTTTVDDKVSGSQIGQTEVKIDKYHSLEKLGYPEDEFTGATYEPGEESTKSNTIDLHNAKILINANEKDHGNYEYQIGEEPVEIVVKICPINNVCKNTCLGGLAAGGAQSFLVGIDGSYVQDNIFLSYAGATNFSQGLALYLSTAWYGRDNLKLDFSVEHIRGEIGKAGQLGKLTEGTEVKLAAEYELNSEFTVGAETKVQKPKIGTSQFTDQIKVAYQPENDFRGELGLRSQGERFGFISNKRKVSAFVNANWRPVEKLELRAGSELAFPLAADAWQLRLSSSYALSRIVSTQAELKASMAELLQGKGNWVLGLNVTPQGWPDLYGQYKIPVSGEQNEFALGLRHAITFSNGISLRANAEGTYRQIGAELVSGYAFGAGVAYDEKPEFRPTLQVEYSSREQDKRGRVSAAVTGHIEPGVSYEAEANWYFGKQAEKRDVLLREFQSALAYRDKETTDHVVLVQYLGRVYRLSNEVGFESATKSVHAGALEWGYNVNKDLTVTAQGAVKFTTERSRDLAQHHSTIYLGQLGTEYKFAEDYSISLFGRLLQDDSGATKAGAAIELARRMNENLTLAVGYSTLELKDPDLSTLVDWPNSFYLRLRLKF